VDIHRQPSSQSPDALRTSNCSLAAKQSARPERRSTRSSRSFQHFSGSVPLSIALSADSEHAKNGLQQRQRRRRSNGGRRYVQQAQTSCTPWTLTAVVCATPAARRISGCAAVLSYESLTIFSICRLSTAGRLPELHTSIAEHASITYKRQSLHVSTKQLLLSTW